MFVLIDLANRIAFTQCPRNLDVCVKFQMIIA